MLIIPIFFFFLLLITQIWGLVNQSQLDDRALAAAERGMQSSGYSLNVSNVGALFRTHCGARMDEGARFCSRCGKKDVKKHKDLVLCYVMLC